MASNDVYVIADTQTRVRAVQLSWRQWNEFCELIGRSWLNIYPARFFEPEVKFPVDSLGEKSPYIEVDVPTPYGEVTMTHGTWLIKLGDEHYIIMHPHSFSLLFKPLH